MWREVPDCQPPDAAALMPRMHDLQFMTGLVRQGNRLAGCHHSQSGCASILADVGACTAACCRARAAADRPHAMMIKRRTVFARLVQPGHLELQHGHLSSTLSMLVSLQLHAAAAMLSILLCRLQLLLQLSLGCHRGCRPVLVCCKLLDERLQLLLQTLDMLPI